MFHQGWVGGCYFKTQPSQHVIYWFRTRKMLYHPFHPQEINQCNVFQDFSADSSRPPQVGLHGGEADGQVRGFYIFSLEKESILLHLPCLSMSRHVSSYFIISHHASLSRKAPGESYTAQAKAKVGNLNVYGKGEGDMKKNIPIHICALEHIHIRLRFSGQLPEVKTEGKQGCGRDNN